MSQRRLLLLPGLVLAHALLLIIIAGSRSAAQPVQEVQTMAVVAVSAPRAEAAEPALVEIAVPADVAAPEILPAEAPGSATACAVADAVRAGLIADPATGAALAAIPVEARTVANAVMLWDGGWASLPASGSQAGLAQLREIVVASVRALPAACRTQPMTGPRLIMIPDRAGTMVLAFGSGNWTWAQLIT